MHEYHETHKGSDACVCGLARTSHMAHAYTPGRDILRLCVTCRRPEHEHSAPDGVAHDIPTPGETCPRCGDDLAAHSIDPATVDECYVYPRGRCDADAT